MQSLLMWECGLKHSLYGLKGTNREVTPYVGVWIETSISANDGNSLLSLLMWECGLKPAAETTLVTATSSLLMWECGLKQFAGGEADRPVGSLLMWECGLKQPCTS